MTIRYAMTSILALPALLLLEGCGCQNEDYYCDEDGCYYCDGMGCREATPPTYDSCVDDWDCDAGEICTQDGCVPTGCEEDGDCPDGTVCVEVDTSRGFEHWCLPPDVEDPPDEFPVDCTTDPGICPAGYFCTPSGNCAPEEGDDCWTDADCGTGAHCEDNSCVADSPGECSTDADCGPDQECTGGACVPTGTTGCVTDGDCGSGWVCYEGTCYEETDPILPTPQCISNADCDFGWECVDAVCMLPCWDDSDCGPGCSCVDGYCTDPSEE